jgi:hypothetical protein
MESSLLKQGNYHQQSKEARGGMKRSSTFHTTPTVLAAIGGVGAALFLLAARSVLDTHL